MSIYILLVIAGVAGGFIAGLIGIGGGLIYVLVIPDALIALKAHHSDIPKLTIANSLFAIFAGSIAVNYIHFKDKIYLKEILYIGLPSVLSSVLFFKFLVNTPFYSVFHFNIITILIMVYLLINTYFSPNKGDKQFAESQFSPAIMVSIGSFSGALAALSGLGGGIVVIPMLQVLQKYPIRQASVVSSGVIMLSTFFTSVYNAIDKPPHTLTTLHTGLIVWPIVFLLSLGVAISSSYGVKYSKKLSNQTLKHIFMVVVLIVILKKITELF